MSIFTPWHHHSLHGHQLLESQEDWLIQLTDTLGNHLHHHDQSHALGECLELLAAQLHQLLKQEEQAFAALGHQVDCLHQTAHQQLCLVIETLCERHQRGEPVGEHLLRQLQDWLLEHCGQFHTESLHH